MKCCRCEQPALVLGRVFSLTSMAQLIPEGVGR